MNIAQNWRMNGQRYGFKGVQCTACGTNHIAPREICPVCQAKLPAVYDFNREQPVLLDIPAMQELRHAAR
jgi:uncharacterized OB-fold protein